MSKSYQPETGGSLQTPICLLLSILALLQVGCQGESLPTTYGRRRGAIAEKSVNGTTVLSEMFEAEGWETASWRRLSPKLYEADVIVWIPDSFSPPSDEQVQWLRDWMDSDYGVKTLVYVGRGYDAAPEYWRRVLPKAPAEDADWMREEQKQAEYELDSDLNDVVQPVESPWFEIEKRAQPLDVDAFDPTSVWAAGVDASQVDITLRTKLQPPPTINEEDLEVLLATDKGELIAYDLYSQDDNVVVVVDGSFLLNLPLVNPEHRKLAGHLIDTCMIDRPGKVVFLEQTPLRLEIFDTEPTVEQPSGFTMLTIWPLGFLLLHLIMIGAVICFVAFPIFGRAKRLKNLGLSDFGKHIHALGELLAATGNRNYALERLKHYEEHVRRETRES